MVLVQETKTMVYFFSQVQFLAGSFMSRTLSHLDCSLLKVILILPWLS
uniref:Uncharacterized protein n=1 Tax=Rhizophora mucronata TaxID=61149 RepID=A0A2P2IM97_RHIMU